jgi:hypothetical protein
VPLLGDIMNAVQTRHMKLWFAGKAFNWELATYELRLGPGSRSLRSLVRDDVDVASDSIFKEPKQFKYDSAFPRRERPRFAGIFRPTEGVGNAGCPMHPQPRVRNGSEHTSIVTEGTAGFTRHSHTQWF